MADYFEECARNDVIVPIKETALQFAVEMIGKTAFGFYPDCIGKKDDEFTHFAKNVVMYRGATALQQKLRLLAIRFPLFLKMIKLFKISYIDPANKSAEKYLRSVLAASTEQRYQLARDGQAVMQDLLQTLLAARPGNPIKESLPDDQRISDTEFVGNSLVMIVAGTETSSGALQCVFALLAMHPEVQDRVYDELSRELTDNFDYDDLSRLTYLDQVICEVLRLYPPVPTVRRRATQTRTYGSITIPRGADIVMPIHGIHNNPCYYPDPARFDPDRFAPAAVAARYPMAFLPFSQGPRRCLGRPLALLTLKLAVVRVLGKVRLELSQHTEPRVGEGIRIAPNRFFTDTVNPVKLAVRLRE